MNIRHIGLIGLLLTAATPSLAAPAVAKHSYSQGDNVQIAQDFLRAIERGETDGLRRFLTDDYVQVEMPNAATPKGQSRGLEATIVGARKGVEILEWQRYDFKNVMAAGDWVIIETGWKAKLKGGWGKLPNGFIFDATIAIFMQFRDGKIAFSRDYDSYQPFGL